MNKFRIITYGILFAIFPVISCQNKKTQQNREDKENGYLQLVEKKINKLRDENLNLTIDDQKVHFGADSLTKFDLKEIAANHILFLFFSYETCSPCVLQAANYIKEVFPDYEKDDRIIFISPDYPARFRRNCYGKKLLTLSNGKLGIPLEYENVPFIFTLTDELIINKLNIVNKNNFIKTLEFLKTI